MTSGLVAAIEPSDETVNAFIRERLMAFNRARVGWPDRKHFTVTLRDSDGVLRGGLTASVNLDMMRIDELFVEEGFRRGGAGRRLLALSEMEGMRLGARNACVTTYSWQARPFYEMNGYAVFASLPYADGAHTLYWLKKALRDGP